MFRRVTITCFLTEMLMNSRYPGRPVGGDLLANGQVQAHVQEWVGLATLRLKIGIQRGLIEHWLVFRMFLHHGGNLCLKRAENLGISGLLPCIHIHLAQFVPVLAEYHQLVPVAFCLNSQRSRITHSGHSGFLALQT